MVYKSILCDIIMTNKNSYFNVCEIYLNFDINVTSPNN